MGKGERNKRTSEANERSERAKRGRTIIACRFANHGSLALKQRALAREQYPRRVRSSFLCSSNNIIPLHSLPSLYFFSRGLVCSIREHEGDRRKVAVFRIMAAVPPIIGASFVRQLDTITEYTGLTGFIIVFVFPGLLHVSSLRACKKKGVVTETGYSTRFTRAGWVSHAVIALGVVLCVFVLANLLYRDVVDGSADDDNLDVDDY